MADLQKIPRPVWCPHADCGFLWQTHDSACVGKLPSPDPHDGDFNTHRLCLHGARDDGEWTFDFKVNKSDAWHLSRLLRLVMEQNAK